MYRQKFNLDEKLDQAIENDSFELFLQPRYSIDETKIFGAKASLLSKDKTLSYSQILSYYERNKGLEELFIYTLEKVCGMLDGLKKMSVECVPIYVSTSSCAITDKSITALMDFAKKYDIKDCIYISIIKLNEPKNSYCLTSYINMLKNAGYKIEFTLFEEEIADINKFIKFPIDSVSFDFRNLMGQDYVNKYEPLISTVIRLCQWLNIPMIAEGVEHQRQIEFLKSVGGDFMQGRCLSPPVSCTEFARMISNRKMPDVLSVLSDKMPSDESIFDFESFFLPLGIFEFRKNALEYVKINKRLRSLVNIEKSAHDAKQDLLFYANKDDYDKIIFNLNMMVENIDEMCVEASFDRYENVDETIKLRINAKCIRRGYKKCIFIALIEEIKP